MKSVLWLFYRSNDGLQPYDLKVLSNFVQTLHSFVQLSSSNPSFISVDSHYTHQENCIMYELHWHYIFVYSNVQKYSSHSTINIRAVSCITSVEQNKGHSVGGKSLIAKKWTVLKIINSSSRKFIDCYSIQVLSSKSYHRKPLRELFCMK